MRHFRDTIHAAERIVAERTETRAPSVATSALTYVAPGAALPVDWDAYAATAYAYLANTIVFACVRTIARSIAGSTLKAGPDLTQTNRTTPNSALARLLGPGGRPNPAMSARRLWAYSIAQRIVTGRFAWEIETSNGKPDGEIVAFWPLVSSKLDAIPSDGGDSYWSGFKYRLSRGRARSLAPWQVHYSWDPSPDDPRKPFSPLQSARLDVEVAVMADRYMAAFLRNDARPAGIIVHEAFDNADERKAFRQQFQEWHGGPDNANRLAFAEATSGGGQQVSGSIDYKQLGISQKDAQFLAIYERKLMNICIDLGVPMGMLDSSGRTFSNAGLEVRNYYEATVIPLASDVIDDVNAGLAQRMGPDVAWFDFSHVEALRPPQKFQNFDPVTLRQQKIVARDEIRDDLGFGPADATVYPDLAEDMATEPPDLLKQAQAALALVQAGYDRQGVLDACGLPKIESETADPETPTEDQPSTMPAPAMPGLSMMGRPAGDEQREQEEYRRERRAIVGRQVDAHTAALEQMWQRALRALFARQRDATLARLRGKRGWQAIKEQRDDAPLPPKAADAIFDRSHWQGETEQTADGLYSSVVAVAGGRLAGELGISFSIASPFVQQFIRSRANQLAGQVTETTYQQIKEALIEGLTATDADGNPAPDDVEGLAARVRGVFDEADTLRSETIARTEVVSAYNGSTWEVGSTLPEDVVAGQEWIATQDPRTRDTHAEADGQVVATGTPFLVGGMTLRYPGDPDGLPEEVINCRCTLRMVTPDEMRSVAPHLIEARAVAVLLTRLAAREIDLDAAITTLEARAA